MKLRLATLSAALLAILAGPAAAHSDEHGKTYHFGRPGNAADVTRIIKVEAADAYEFKHEPLDIKLGETIRFVVTNTDNVEHEFAVGDTASQRAHAAMMRKMPHMSHQNDPTAVTLQPGETKDVIWTFDKPVQGQIELACHTKDHYDMGMVSKLKLVK